MDVPGISRPVLVALIAVAALLFAAGASWAVSWLTRETDTNTQTLVAASSIEIEGHSGDIRVVGSDRSDIRLTTKQHRSIFGRPYVRATYSGGRLLLDGDCSDIELWGGCGVSYRLEVPRDVAVRLSTHSGDVSAEDLRGDAELQTRSGDVNVEGLLGKLRMQTRSGDVNVDSASTDIDADSRSGDVDVRASNATRVRAQTSSGDVNVIVPDRTYAVQAQAASGDENVVVRTDPRAPRTIDAQTSSGDVNVAPDG